jgi:hypothetical protein
MRVTVDGRGITSENGVPVLDIKVPTNIAGRDMHSVIEQLSTLVEAITKMTGSIQVLESKIEELEKHTCTPCQHTCGPEQAQPTAAAVEKPVAAKKPGKAAAADSKPEESK